MLNKAPRGIAGVIDLDDLDVKNATCTIHAAAGTGTRCGGPALYFYVKHNLARGITVLPRCESHRDTDPFWGDDDSDPNWNEITREELLNLQLVEETMQA